MTDGKRTREELLTSITDKARDLNREADVATEELCGTEKYLYETGLYYIRDSRSDSWVLKVKKSMFGDDELFFCRLVWGKNREGKLSLWIGVFKKDEDYPSSIVNIDNAGREMRIEAARHIDELLDDVEKGLDEAILKASE